MTWGMFFAIFGCGMAVGAAIVTVAYLTGRSRQKL